MLSAGTATARETLPPLSQQTAPSDYAQMWEGFDPRREPLEVELLHEWEQDNVQLRVVRFRIGNFKGQTARLAAVYGFPQSAAETPVPGLVQIHGGGQYADYQACLANARRGYATVSIAWAGRISAPDYRVSPAEVRLFWEGKTNDPRFRLTTDWGALDGYHAPSRNAGNQFPSIRPASWTLDSIESPRNSGWFLCALAARRALTFLERQPEVDTDRLGVYGHSMGGKLTAMVAGDSRVKAAAPSCGGISDRDNTSELFNNTIGDGVSLKQITCPIMFLSPANDFHGRIGDLPAAVTEIQSRQWRVTCSPHHNHQDTAEYETATLLWFDQHLRGQFQYPLTPVTSLELDHHGGVPIFSVKPDTHLPVHSIDVYYTLQGKEHEQSQDRDATVHRFWHYAKPEERNGIWTARLPLSSTHQPLWVFANVRYALQAPSTGAGYYYRPFVAKSFVVSSLLTQVPAETLAAAGVKQTLHPADLIEDFESDWRKEWFSYRLEDWSRSTNKLNSPVWQGPAGARLTLNIKSTHSNKLVIKLDEYATEVELHGRDTWQHLELEPKQFRSFEGASLKNWKDIRQLTLGHTVQLRPQRGQTGTPKTLGSKWAGPPPQFRRLRWSR